MLKRAVLLFLLVVASSRAWAQNWPSLAQQLADANVVPGSALEKLVRENQDFTLLRPEESNDLIGIPFWLRIGWRKAHPEGGFLASDPSGGYPRVLKDAAVWMLNHQDLTTPGAQEPAAKGKSALVASAGTNLRISGLQTSARSESDIRVNFFSPSKIIGASNAIVASGLQAQFFSTDTGATWGQTTLPLGPAPDAFDSDPTVEWTSDGTAWSSTLGIDGGATQLRMRHFKSADNGATWAFEATASGAQTSVDKQMEWADHSASSPFKDQLYVIWHNNLPVFMNRRTAGAAGTWGTPIQVSGAETTGTGIGSDVKTNSAGHVFGFWPDTGSKKLFVVKSTSGGASYGTPVQIATTFDSYDIGVPSFATRRALIYTSGGAYKNTALCKDNVYATWVDLSGEVGCTAPANEPKTSLNSTCKTRIWFASSTNGGATWGAKKMLNNQASRSDQYNQWMAVDETTGALGVMYYDTVGDPLIPVGCTNTCTGGRKKTDVWYQSSFDDGATWTAAVRVTTAQTDETVAGANSGNQYGDYNGLSGYAGHFFPSWTDRRSNLREEIWTANITDICVAPATPTAGSNSPLCAGQTLNLTASSVTPGVTYSWTGPGGFTSCLQNPSIANVTAANAGTYSVVANRACNSIAGTVTVTVNPVPAAPTASNDGPKCAGTTLNLSTPTVVGATYSWTGPNGFVSATQNPAIANVTTAATGTYNVTVTVGGCTSAAGATTATVTACAAPTISSIVRPCASTVGGLSVTITGNNFQTNATVTLVGTPATVTALSATSITATTGVRVAAPAVTGNVVVTNPDSQTGTLVGGFTYGLRGDANNSGGLSPSDASWLNDYFAGAGPLPAFPCIGGDANSTGSLTPTDASYLNDYFAGAGPAPGP